MNGDKLTFARREFLRRTAGFAGLGLAGPTALNMASVGRVAAATAEDYKAIVCIFLYGANDHYNTYVPFDTDNHAAYLAARANVATDLSLLQNSVLSPITPLPDSKEYALAPQLADLYPLWGQQDLAVLLNVGPLSQPTSKLEYEAKSVPLPPKIFSHVDHQSIWQSLRPEGESIGWGGRIADLFLSSNIEEAFTCISVSSAGNSLFLSGEASVQTQVSTAGSVSMTPVTGKTYSSTAVSAAVRQLMTAGYPHLMKQAHSDIVSRSIHANDILTAALNSIPSPTTAFGGGPLSAQLELVARIISVRQALGVKRQVFFVGMGGFDNHNDQLLNHPPLLVELNQAMSAFYAATEEMAITNQVTSFTSSDFGRTLNSNHDGTDHGWGSHHMIMGGAVNGGEFYGTAPELGDDGPNDVGRGRLLPTTSVEQMAATLAKWFGCSETEILDILPTIAEFDTSDLGFLQS